MLRTVLGLNAVSCLGFGALFFLWPGEVAGFLGSAPRGLVAVLGALLLGNGLHLAHAARRGAGAGLLRYFAIGDFGWVGTSLALVASGLWITAPGGIVAALTVAAMVASFGLLQWQGAAEAGRQREARMGW